MEFNGLAIPKNIWQALAAAIQVHIDAGRVHLLTEDALRFALIMLLEDCGIAPDEMRVEVSEPLIRAMLDLAVGQPVHTVFELKFPRDSRTGSSSADTVTCGSLLKDFYRLARLSYPERWAVQLINDRLRRHLERRTDVSWRFVPGETLELPAGLPSRLPESACRGWSSWADALEVRATVFAEHFVSGHTLAVYRVH